jgi:predicted DNA-binding ribbon-helix-helix protein
MRPPKAPRGKSLVVKRAVKLDGHKTSVSLEGGFWSALRVIAAEQGTSARHLISTIDSERRERQHPNLSSAIRLFVLDYYRSRCSRETEGSCACDGLQRVPHRWLSWGGFSQESGSR